MKRREFLRQLGGGLAMAVAPESLLRSFRFGIPDPIAERLTLKDALPEQRVARFMAVGDIMTHSMIVKHALQKDGSYDFVPYFADVAPVLSQGDFVLGNFETRVAGQDKGWLYYPRFNAPDSLAPAIAGAGFSLLCTANNHCMDMGAQGVIRTNRILEQNGLLQTGTAASAEDAAIIRILEKNGVRLAVLAYTYGTNGMPIPKDKPWMVNLIDREVIRRDIAKTRKLKADFVAVFLHYGTEYVRHPDGQQKKLVGDVLGYGADIVLGSHPHVAQPMEMVRINGQDRAVIYSMGNFLANQLQKYTYLGVIFSMDLCIEPDGSKRLINVQALPTKTIRDRQPGHACFRILPIQRTLENSATAALGKKELRQLELDLKEMNAFFTSLS